jgi:energy-coupling factor transport system ATP-binding protein
VQAAISDIHRSGKTVVVLEQRVGRLLEDATRCVVLREGRLLFDGRPGAARSLLLKEHILPQYPEKIRPDLPDNGPLLAVQDLSYEIETREILKHVSLDIRAGEILAIVGRNGSGKTTLIKHFNGLLRPATGALTLMGEGIRGKSPSELAPLVGISFQNANDQFFKNRVEDELRVGLKAAAIPSEDWIEEIGALFELPGLMARSPYRLSEGEKKRVALASIAVIRPRLLILDEPTVGQDGRFLEAIAALIQSLQKRGFTIVIVTHDLDFARATAERWIVMHQGKKVADGPPVELLGDEHLIQMGALDRHESWRASGA